MNRYFITTYALSFALVPASFGVFKDVPPILSVSGAIEVQDGTGWPEPVKKPVVKPKPSQDEYNPNNCNLDKQWVWASDRSCHDKEVMESVAKPVVSAPTSDWVAQCRAWAELAGVPLPQAAISLIDRESDCDPNAVNPTSGACGIGQQLPCGKWPGAWNDPIAGLRGMYNYVLGRYGSWEQALAHSLSNNWY